MQLQNKLLQMKDGSFMYMAKVHKFINFKIIDDTVHLVTDKNWFEIPVKKADEFLKDFIRTRPEEPVFKDNGHSEENLNGKEMVIYEKSKEANLVGTLIDTIDKIKADKNYTSQAKAITSVVNTILNAAKVEIEINKRKR